jgi:hypothetical protein
MTPSTPSAQCAANTESECPVAGDADQGIWKQAQRMFPILPELIGKRLGHHIFLSYDFRYVLQM